MHPAVLTEYIRKRMEELGYGENYHLRLRHIAIPGDAVTTLDIENQLLILLQPVEMIRIESDLGVFELSGNRRTVFELQYEHTGRVRIENMGSYDPIHIQFLQVIGVDRKPSPTAP